MTDTYITPTSIESEDRLPPIDSELYRPSAQVMIDQAYYALPTDREEGRKRTVTIRLAAEVNALVEDIVEKHSGTFQDRNMFVQFAVLTVMRAMYDNGLLEETIPTSLQWLDELARRRELDQVHIERKMQTEQDDVYLSAALRAFNWKDIVRQLETIDNSMAECPSVSFAREIEEAHLQRQLLRFAIEKMYDHPAIRADIEEKLLTVEASEDERGRVRMWYERMESWGVRK